MDAVARSWAEPSDEPASTSARETAHRVVGAIWPPKRDRLSLQGRVRNLAIRYGARPLSRRTHWSFACRTALLLVVGRAGVVSQWRSSPVRCSRSADVPLASEIGRRRSRGARGACRRRRHRVVRVYIESPQGGILVWNLIVTSVGNSVPLAGTTCRRLTAGRASRRYGADTSSRTPSPTRVRPVPVASHKHEPLMTAIRSRFVRGSWALVLKRRCHALELVPAKRGGRGGGGGGPSVTRRVVVVTE